MRNRGIEVHVFGPTTANGVVESIHELGAILGRKSQAQTSVRDLMREISRIATDRDGKRRLEVVWILRRDPLTVVGSEGMLHQMLELAGGEMAMHRLRGVEVAVDLEALLASEPDLILDSSRDQPMAIGVRTEALPASISELPTLDLLGRIRAVYAVLYP